MKPAMLLSTLALAGTTLANAAPVAAKLQNATIFLNGAQLIQTAQLDLEQGDNTILIEALSPQLNQQSLQLAIPGGCIISNYEYSLDYLSQDKQTVATEELSKKLEVKRAALKLNDEKIRLNTRMQELLEAGINSSFDVEGINLSSETIEKNLSYFQKRAQQLSQEATALADEHTILTEEIKSLERNLKQNSTKNARRSGLLTLVVNSPKKQKLTAQIKYFTPSASWYPTYDLNITSIDRPINLMMKAHVQQTTGLDWEDVSLTLSTAAPSRSNKAPELSTWWVKKYEVMQNGVYVSRSLRSMPIKDKVAEEAASYDMIAVEEETAVEPTVQKYVATQSDQLSVEYKIDLKYSILGNGKEQIIALLEKPIEDVEFKYFAAPKLDNQAYLTAEIANWEKLDLMDGNANITYNGTFYGQTFLSSRSTDNKLRLTLGDDQQISIKREKLSEQTEKKFIGSTKTQTYSFKTIIRNNKKEAVSLIVKDQYPVSQDKDIVVSLLDKSTKSTQIDTDKNILTYSLNLQPGETVELLLSYSIKSPKDWTLNF